MVTKLTKGRSAHRGVLMNTRGSTAISPEALQAWGRVPQHNKAEIIEAVERPSPASSFDTKTVKVGPKLLTVRRMSSGFRVVYEPGDGRNTIVSVMTPREAGLIKD